MLMSGGHCLLAVVEDVTKFKLLGTCLDTSPGDMLDKVVELICCCACFTKFLIVLNFHYHALRFCLLH